jgi:hypothetical protein
MTGRFDSVWLKLGRAKKHVGDLEAEIIAFWATKPYEIETEGDPKTGVGSIRIKGDPKPLPDSIPLIAGDAAHNLRSALDHFACGAVARVTGNTAFPVWRASPMPTSAEWRGEVNGKLSGAHPRLLQAVRSAQAYQTGNGQYLWAVNELDRIDKHRLLLSVAGINSVITVDFGEVMRGHFQNLNVPSMPVGLRPVWTPIENGTELFANQSGAQFDTDPHFTFEVAFGEPEILKGEPVVPALRRLIDEVESLLQRLIPLA